MAKFKFRPEHKKLLVWVILVFVITLMVYLFWPIFPPYQTVKAQSPTDQPLFTSIKLKVPPDAMYTYFYGTPIYVVGQEVLHWANFQLSATHLLNFYTYYYKPESTATLIGTDEQRQFLFVMMDDTGQVGWIPLIQTDLEPWLLQTLPIITLGPSLPDYSDYDVSIPDLNPNN